jgi:formylglycine-generating enzyme required for sulfatase activity
VIPALLVGLGVSVLGLLLLVDLPAPVNAADPDPSKVITNSLGMKLAYIPAGKFLMGSPAGEADRDEGETQHEVTITRPFYLGVYEVTQGEFTKLIAATGKARAIFTAQRGGGPSNPMENLTWDFAVQFCKALTNQPAEKEAGRRYRLPTEAEWEYACRAGTTTPFHFGKSLNSKEANFNGNYPYGGAEKGPYLRKTDKVGSHAPNAWGLYDMHGNVAEWCSDFYDPDYYRKSPKEDPKGPEKGVVPTDYDGFYRVIRGGSWLDEGRACRSAYRSRAMPHDPYRLIGLRVVCEVTDR